MPIDGAEKADDDDELPTPNARLLEAAARGDAELVERLISNDDDDAADPDCARAEDGATPLMVAAEGGHADAVASLLRAGAQWNALDCGGHCAGEYSGAAHAEVTQMLMQWGVEMEEMLIERDEGGAEAASDEGAAAAAKEEDEESRRYLSQRLVYDDADPSGPRLLDSDGDAVMMGWEAPIMARHADTLCGGQGVAAPAAVMNVGFGLGIIDRDLQRHAPRRHVIVEAHPDVLARMDAEGWAEKPGVTVLRGRWEDVLAAGAPALSKGAQEGGIADILASGGFDAIYWDTYAQHARHLRRFHAEVLPRLLRRPTTKHARSGKYAWFNGVGSDNAFFHAVSTQVIARHLAKLGFRTSFEKLSVDKLGDDVWRGVARAYWRLPYYLMPLVRWEEDDQKAEKQQQDEEG